MKDTCINLRFNFAVILIPLAQAQISDNLRTTLSDENISLHIKRYLQVRSFWHLLFVGHMQVKSKTDGFSSVINAHLHCATKQCKD